MSLPGRLASVCNCTKGVLTVRAIPECMAPGPSKKARTSHSANGSAEMDRFDPDKSYQIIAHPVLMPSSLHTRTRSVRAHKEATHAHTCKRTRIVFSQETLTIRSCAQAQEALAKRLVESNPTRFTYHITSWGKFKDGTDNIDVGGFYPVNYIRGANVSHKSSYASSFPPSPRALPSSPLLCFV